MSPRQVPPVADREEKAATVRVSKAMAMGLKKKVVRVSVTPAVRKGLPVRAVLKDRAVAIRKPCCSRLCHSMRMATEH
jgi:hypothetical protein